MKAFRFYENKNKTQPLQFWAEFQRRIKLFLHTDEYDQIKITVLSFILAIATSQTKILAMKTAQKQTEKCAINLC